ncbi:acyltransferase family protein [Levilactobacillus acidifarinae]|uniref:Acyltransferase 3 domain-containing protein n=1 Tax=Levilactobacillus acidifarinae DSM 19394 = JCM 15949 TaxID=1423715 RepID=A0A0R1LGM7_9LACO|nr:acyltransferase [Levilactobacillus acidifarinae]KRK94805.1 hypothetical protein FD25_GL000781 [Levilactobacillus acidifarinae DSM 19394]GEO68564.1 membrane protein [Levilactobacillus acidifarinae]
MEQRVTPPVTDIGDYLKVAACTAVMLQSVLGFAMAAHPTARQQWVLGSVYNLVKFTAPAFIFGILYTTIRQRRDFPLQTNRQYWRQQWSALGVPTVWWTVIYLEILPGSQQHGAYQTVGQFLWQAVSGNAAPHLWYNTMMLQFIGVMPLFWVWSRWVGRRQARAWVSLGVTGLFYGGWLWWFPHAPTYLVDRLALSFLPYAVTGALWAQFKSGPRTLQRYWPVVTLAWLGAWGWLSGQLVARGLPVRLAAASYYQLSGTFYAFTVIGLVSCLAVTQLRHRSAWLQPMHWLATYAYRAYLSHVFWLAGMWALTGNWPLGWRVVVSYLGTWGLAFVTTYGLHLGWQRLKWQRH